ncbi:DUF2637 domain-containing protein [Streptomyces sp. RKAG337]|uniref:DUF2637 domain-containing protein n=1 Tax=Streptomyces sp. RKAG337 TaxID=2893404 RepID=UPI002033B0C8|nr:DUF2637 domain-containing protein [Streptomyces sp. RKAG337]MCM2428807.1 DUF2637 domain-containing protein [Streptomyces sp. RKAG337]
MLDSLTSAQVESVERTLNLGTWAITGGAVLYSVLTVTPLVEHVTPAEWQWTAPILPLVVDAAVVIVIRLDAVVARLGGSGGMWPAVLRWMTGLMTLLLNVGNSALAHDLVGMAVHSVAPLLLIVTAEAGRAYRHAISTAMDRIERSRAEDETAREQQAQQTREREQQAREHAEHQAREHAQQVERERAEREERLRREEHEHTARLERERFEREAELQREQREHADQVRREEQQREDRQRREQYERESEQRREHREQTAREQQARALETGREQAQAAVREHPQPDPVNTPPEIVNAPPASVNTDGGKASEVRAREIVRESIAAGRSVRQMADETGWSIGWISARIAELREQATESPRAEVMAG